MKLVSVIIPVYNAQDTIQRAIDSALNQNFPKKDFEVIVVNDGSTDKTLDILKKYNKKIKIINQQNQGAVRAANVGFKRAKGKYVIKLDADDFFEQNILKEMVKILDQKPKIDFVYCDYYEKLKNGKIKRVSTENIFNTLAGGIMFRKNKLAREGFYRKDIKFPEYDLLLKTQKKWQGFHIQKPLFYYNRSKKSLTGNKQWTKEAMGELKKLHLQKIEEIKKIRKY